MPAIDVPLGPSIGSRWEIAAIEVMVSFFTSWTAPVGDIDANGLFNEALIRISGGIAINIPLVLYKVLNSQPNNLNVITRGNLISSQLLLLYEAEVPSVEFNVSVPGLALTNFAANSQDGTLTIYGDQKQYHES